MDHRQAVDGWGPEGKTTYILPRVTQDVTTVLLPLSPAFWEARQDADRTARGAHGDQEIHRLDILTTLKSLAQTWGGYLTTKARIRPRVEEPASLCCFPGPRHGREANLNHAIGQNLK